MPRASRAVPAHNRSTAMMESFGSKSSPQPQCYSEEAFPHSRNNIEKENSLQAHLSSLF